MDKMKDRSAANVMNNKARSFRPMYKKLSLAALSFLAAFTLSACGGNKDSSNNMNSNSYGNDGYMGLSNSNPNLPNRNGQFLNYNDDGNFAKKQLMKVEGVATSTMMFQGPNLYVTIKTKPGFDDAKVRQKAISTLRYNMPRYTVHVNTTH